MSRHQLSSQLRGVEVASTATVNLAYRRADISHKLDGFSSWLFIEKRTLIACTFSSVKFKGRAPADHVLLRAFVGGALQPEMLQLDDVEMVKRVERDLNELLGVKGKPFFVELARWNNSMPQYAVGHLERVAQIEKEINKLTGLALAGNAYSGAGIPDCIRSGEKAAEVLIG